MKTKVLLTIDTEVPEFSAPTRDPFDRFLVGSIDAGEYGALWICDEVKRYGLVAEYFLDVYGCARFSPDRYKELCDYLVRGGHGVQLHTHPGSMYDSKRRNMHEYSLEEQTMIVREGIALLKDWTNEAPRAHRAGNYGANDDTLTALARNGVRVDTSFLYGRENCRIRSGKVNMPFARCGVCEVPVTVAIRPYRRLGISIPFLHAYQKLDINQMAELDICGSLLRLWGRVPYIILFLHSFSFIRRVSMADEYVCNETAIDCFKSVLCFLAKEKMPTARFSDVGADFAATNSLC